MCSEGGKSNGSVKPTLSGRRWNELVGISPNILLGECFLPSFLKPASEQLIQEEYPLSNSVITKQQQLNIKIYIYTL
jgi:hypothetical protein